MNIARRGSDRPGRSAHKTGPALLICMRCRHSRKQVWPFRHGFVSSASLSAVELDSFPCGAKFSRAPVGVSGLDFAPRTAITSGQRTSQLGTLRFIYITQHLSNEWHYESQHGRIASETGKIECLVCIIKCIFTLLTLARPGHFS